MSSWFFRSLSQAVPREILTVLGQLDEKIRFHLVSRGARGWNMVIFLWTKVVFPVFWPFSGKPVITVIVLKFKKTKKTLSYFIPITNLAKYEPNRKTLKNQLDIPNHGGEIFPRFFPNLCFIKSTKRDTWFFGRKRDWKFSPFVPEIF